MHISVQTFTNYILTCRNNYLESNKKDFQSTYYGGETVLSNIFFPLKIFFTKCSEKKI